jgi:Polyketide cyclase / dehydrase and lipid transport
MALRRFEYSAESTVPPERVIAAATDFSDRRPDIWPALSRSQYRVLEKGDKGALVREGTAVLWAVEKYDWSEPGVVSWTVQESNFLRPGTVWEMRVTPTEGGGSKVDVTMERNYKGARGGFMQLTLDIFGGARMLRRLLRRTLDILEREKAQV